ncbi:TetR/AcrR family transcriptional regulator [Curvibacter sp. CHRR-16]|uniref:TetR/AcrR family transcriptional regulator n=1 Tax=Curvibacter sp. CHRR-16 TaxID=2835872 RepID=UPI001BDB1399|nr:TetR/AcrR family transcriptional regulator [Curvibacter sp. CHRR-16]MBT0570975.1 TetR/AcrR family transcriptional regulator [Curvibacter sp. CHRR-16]
MIPTIADTLCTAKRSRRKEARPGELLSAAMTLFTEKGFAATRVEDIAKRAGVSKGTLFLYFSSKEDLFKAVVRENIQGRFSEWREMIDTFEGSTRELIHTCTQQWWEHMVNTNAAGIDLVLINEGEHFPDLVHFYQTEVMMPGHALVRTVIERGIAKGEFRPLNAEYATYSLVALMNFMNLVKHKPAFVLPQIRSLDMTHYLATQVDYILHGFNAPSAP